mgnify:CR=1 FL=1
MPDGSDAALQSFVDDAVEKALADDDATGAAVAVVRDGDVALTEGYGHAILDEDVPIEADRSLFQLGSTVKAVTWTAAMQQVDRGRVDPHAGIESSLTSVPVPESDEPVTLADLATHTAGFEARVVGDKVFDRAHRRPLPETLTDEQPPVVRPPGELPGYTNYAAGLAGQLVADVTGTSYADYVEREIFEPLGMEQATFDPAPDGLGAGPDDSYFDEIDWYSDIRPASGMSATATDMAQFVLAHLDGGAGERGRILSPAATAEMHRQWYAARDGLDGLAFGFVEETRDGTRVLSHSGQVPGFATDLLLVPEADLGVFVSVQGESPGGALGEVREALLDEFAPVEEATLTPDRRPTRADELSGTYRTVHGTDAETYNRLPMAAAFGAVEVSVADDGALVTDRGGRTARWVEVEPLVFRRADGRESLTVLDREEGLHLVFGGSAAAYERIGPHERFEVQAPVAAGAAAVALSGAVGWPALGAYRRLRDRPGVSTDARRARRVAYAGVGSLLALVAGLVGVGLWTVSTGVPSLQAYPPAGFGLLFYLPVVGGVAVVGAAVYALRAWYRGDWSLPARVHYTAVVAATALLVWLCHYWRLAA